MSKAEARRRVEDGEFSWEDIGQLLRDTWGHLCGSRGRERSRVNSGCTNALAFNLYWKACLPFTGEISTRQGARHLIAVNVLRDFGQTNMVRRLKPPQAEPAHEELIDLS